MIKQIQHTYENNMNSQPTYFSLFRSRFIVPGISGSLIYFKMFYLKIGLLFWLDLPII